ncbi:amylo-alpha-1,6-glucosidase [Noviherbaspirillum pedocola]|uniref:Amylo-alpha-1,6-glucosidase n=1 Tax=Noviherbaspirillum pedocola TaxID=2801341 RepID=A0A934SU96_9BURK|nr:amylo-alpha-1,6-glucosidase [Noviherbaspirillum pedocola]MBK4735348.1 amylo-alpha-1,6-glucosidase [Noviherbaspirillum pedocola]
MIQKVRLGEEWYILAAASPVDERRRVLKDNETFAVFDRFGDAQSIGLGEEGIYYGDTCFLSHLEMQIGGMRPMFLNSTVRGDNGLFVIELMNPDLHPGTDEAIPKGVLHLFRAKLLRNNASYEHVRIVNFGLERIRTSLTFLFGSDFKDIFEVRGFNRTRRGVDLPPQVSVAEVLLGYRGLDEIVRHTRVEFDPAPQRLVQDQAEFQLDLAPKEEAHCYLTIGYEEGQASAAPRPAYFEVYRRCDEEMRARQQQRCRISSSDPLFNSWVDRSTSDLIMLSTRLRDGEYPYAGLPWYSTTFGRDGILTAWEMLWVEPQMARGVLGFLAANQASDMDPARDAEPGKILHEARNGELARLGETPFRRYYGTVDATPLFVGLAGAYHQRTGDLEFIRSIWTNILDALSWIDEYGDRDGDGFVEYARHTEKGLAQQGWKDSHDSVFHHDGQLAEAPIALCEVQGYVYDAKVQAARLANLLGDHEMARRLESAAAELKREFNRRFWCPEIRMYALALDGSKRQCAVGASNAGHALWSGIATEEYASQVAQSLVSADFFCGWGVRTLRADEVRYNPMAYHNGSVWPHDNALIAAGMARYGMTDKALQIFTGMREVSLYMDQHRMPELFCGFEKRPEEGPTLYPVACSPQAWAAASVFYLLQACLGLSFDAAQNRVCFRNPRLPDFLDSLSFRDLAVGNATVDLQLQRYPHNVGINIVRKDGNVSVVNLA